VKALGLFFQRTPRKYTGNPVSTNRSPIPVSLGAANRGTISRNITAIKKVIGMTRLNC